MNPKADKRCVGSRDRKRSLATVKGCETVEPSMTFCGKQEQRNECEMFFFAKQKIAANDIQFAAMWLGWKDSNLRNDGVRVRCLTTWRHPNTYTTGWDRWIRTIEMTESKSAALPLGYIPI